MSTNLDSSPVRPNYSTAEGSPELGSSFRESQAPRRERGRSRADRRVTVDIRARPPTPPPTSSPTRLEREVTRVMEEEKAKKRARTEVRRHPFFETLETLRRREVCTSCLQPLWRRGQWRIQTEISQSQAAPSSSTTAEPSSSSNGSKRRKVSRGWNESETHRVTQTIDDEEEVISICNLDDK